MIGLVLILIALVILGVSLIVAAFGTIGWVAIIPISAALIWFVLTK